MAYTAHLGLIMHSSEIDVQVGVANERIPWEKNAAAVSESDIRIIHIIDTITHNLFIFFAYFLTQIVHQ